MSKDAQFPPQMQVGVTLWFEPENVIRGDRLAWLAGNIQGLPERTVNPWRNAIVPVTRTTGGLVAQWPEGAFPWTRKYATGLDSDDDMARVFPWCEPITFT